MIGPYRGHRLPGNSNSGNCHWSLNQGRPSSYRQPSGCRFEETSSGSTNHLLHHFLVPPVTFRLLPPSHTKAIESKFNHVVVSWLDFIDSFTPRVRASVCHLLHLVCIFSALYCIDRRDRRGKSGKLLQYCKRGGESPGQRCEYFLIYYCYSCAYRS